MIPAILRAASCQGCGLAARLVSPSSNTFLRHVPVLMQAANKVSVAHVKTLRQRTELPMKLCREALEQSDDDVDKALEWLQNNEEARAQLAKGKLADREVKQGRMALTLIPDAAVLVELSCETDFVARNDKFKDLTELAGAACFDLLKSKAFVPSQRSRVEVIPNELVSVAPVEQDGASTTVQKAIDAALAAIGENIVLRRAAAVVTTGAPGVVGGYIHLHGTYGALAVCDVDGAGLDSDVAAKISEDLNGIAQQIVAIPAPEGELSTEERVKYLLSQPDVFNSSQNLADKITSIGKKNGVELRLVDYLRWQQ